MFIEQLVFVGYQVRFWKFKYREEIVFIFKKFNIRKGSGYMDRDKLVEEGIKIFFLGLKKGEFGQEKE